MSLNPRPFARLVTAGILAALFVIPENILAQAQVEAKIQQAEQAQQHIVSPAELQQATVAASQQRQKNVDTLNNFFSSDQARRTLQSAHINPEQVKNAVAGLSPDEQAQLASRVNSAQADFAAGNLDNNDLLVILLCVAVLILVIVAVR